MDKKGQEFLSDAANIKLRITEGILSKIDKYAAAAALNMGDFASQVKYILNDLKKVKDSQAAYIAGNNIINDLQESAHKQLQLINKSTLTNLLQSNAIGDILKKNLKNREDEELLVNALKAPSEDLLNFALNIFNLEKRIDVLRSSQLKDIEKMSKIQNIIFKLKSKDLKDSILQEKRDKSVNIIEKQLEQVTDRITNTKQEQLSIEELLNEIKVNNVVLDKVQIDIANRIALLSEAKKKAQSDILELIRSEYDEVGELTEAMHYLVTNPTAAFLVLLKLSLEEYGKLTKANRDFLNDSGLLVKETANLRHEIHNIAVEYADYGVSFETAGKAASSLYRTLDNVKFVTDDTVKSVALLKTNFGIVESDSGKVLDILQESLGATLEQARTTAILGANLAAAGGVAPNEVFQDMAQSSRDISIYFRGTKSELIRAAVEARRLGLSIQNIANISKTLLDFESSIENQLEASVLLGREINLDKARELALQGDIDAAAKETLSKIGSLAEFNSLNSIQRQVIAKATGLEVDQLQKALQNQEALNQLSSSAKREYADAGKQLDLMNASTADRILMDRKNLLAQEKLKAVLEKIVLLFTDSLLPIIEPIIDGLSFVGNLLSKFGFIIKPVVWSFLAIKTYNFATTGLLGKMIDSTKMIGSNIFSWVKSIKSFNIAAIFSKDNLDKIKSIFSGGVTKPKENLADTLLDKTKDVASTKIPIGDESKKISDSAKTLTTSGRSLGNVATDMLKGAAALLVLSAAIYVSAKAFQQFTDVDYSQVLKGLGALTLFTAGVFALGSLLSSGVGAYIFGAGVVAITAMAVSVGVLGVSLKILGEGMEMISSSLESIPNNLNRMVASIDPIYSLSDSLNVLAESLENVTSAGLLANPIISGLSHLNNLTVTQPNTKNEESPINLDSLESAMQSINTKLDTLNTNIDKLANRPINIYLDKDKVSRLQTARS